MTEDIKTTLWKSADKLRAQMDAAEYKHIVLGLIFLKYISDKFGAQQEKIRQMVSDPSSDYFISEEPDDYQSELEERDYYIQDNVFWVPQGARWEKLRAQAKQPDIGSIIDNAMTFIENENSSLRGKLDKRFGRAQLNQGVLGELIDLISTIGFGNKYDESDLLGEVYEYFLGQFASAEGKKGGQFYTPSHVVKTLVAVLSPTSGRVYDPCCGSGGMFVQSERFVKAHGGRVDDISIYGQESNPTTWRLAAMNLAIRGFAADLGKEPADTFASDQFPDVKFDYIMANPPFNISDWGGEKYESDPRWKFGRPPVGNANYAWLQHMLWKLRPGGRAGIVLSNGSLTADDGGQNSIRKAMVKAGLIEAIISLPNKLFANFKGGVCIWFLVNKSDQSVSESLSSVLFIDARKIGKLIDRANRTLDDSNIETLSSLVRNWRSGCSYEDIPGLCRDVPFGEIEKNNYSLNPGRYIEHDEDSDSEIFEDRMGKLCETLSELSMQSESLESELRVELEKIGYVV